MQHNLVQGTLHEPNLADAWVGDFIKEVSP